jgi:hypothetical protein
MDTPIQAIGAAFNSAVVVIFRNRKDKLRYTYTQIEESSGIIVRTLKRLFTEENPFNLPQFIAVASALGLDPKDVVEQVEGILAKTMPGATEQSNAKAMN